ncbi:MAG: type IIA DNA topoisomerase subunit B [Candidatus Micrarchaeota archaeon]|nr:type IIA DNA topoisomerase subunit B [Candidatus Micrarchaeota archaeon]
MDFTNDDHVETHNVSNSISNDASSSTNLDKTSLSQISSNKKGSYTAESIKVLEGLEAVRKRPAMYIGDTGIRGLHHLINEIVDNSIDEVLAGYCNWIKVVLRKDGYCEVHDNGRGIPVDEHPTEKRPAIEVVLSVLHAGGKFDEKAYTISGGLHGVGASCVNALSEHLIAIVKRDKAVWQIEFSRGKLIKPLTKIKDLESENDTGTTIIFKPDDEIFPIIEFDRNVVEKRLKELAYINKGVIIELFDERDNYYAKFQFTRGITEYLQTLEPKLLHNPINFYFRSPDNNIITEVAFAFANRYTPMILSYANNINTIEGGTHVIGFRSALTRATNEYAERNNYLKQTNNERFSGEDILEGVVAIISVMVKGPQFEGQTKTKLGNAEVKSFVEKYFYESFSRYLEENPGTAKIIIERCLQAFEARIAAQKAKELVRSKKNLELSLPGKLADCIEKDPEKAELFIVEGDSAGGTARQGRNREYQAILPLRGKILNVEKASISKMLNNEEISALVSAIGTGIIELSDNKPNSEIVSEDKKKGEETTLQSTKTNSDKQESFDLNLRRYSKIIIMTDADVDGAHIRTLLLTFFYRYMKPLIEHGYIYVSQPPLYRVKKGKFERYFYTDEELELFLQSQNDRDSYHVQRYKGLGEMNADQLWQTTMNPETRTLLKVTIQDAAKADELFQILMGEKVEPRKNFIMQHSKEAKLDI